MFLGHNIILTSPEHLALLRQADEVIKGNHPICHDIATSHGKSFQDVKWSAWLQRQVANHLRQSAQWVGVPEV